MNILSKFKMRGARAIKSEGRRVNKSPPITDFALFSWCVIKVQQLISPRLNTLLLVATKCPLKLNKLDGHSYLLIPTAKENFGRHNILEQQNMGGQESTMKLRYKSLSNNMNT